MTFGQNIFGPCTYALIQHCLDGMLYAYTSADYKEHDCKCVKLLELDPNNLDKVTHIYSHPEKFSRHYVRSIIGNAEMLGSQISESNHNMVRAHCGSGSNQYIIAQVRTLLEKQREKILNKEYDDTKYKQKCISESLTINDINDKNALLTLSKNFYVNNWKKMVHNSLEYKLLNVIEDDYHRVIKDYALPNSVRKIRKGQRCNCPTRISTEGM